MTQVPPVHVRLPPEVLDALKARAKAELVPVATLARILIQRGLQQEQERQAHERMLEQRV